MTLAAHTRDCLMRMGVAPQLFAPDRIRPPDLDMLDVRSPIDGSMVGSIVTDTPADGQEKIRLARQAHLAWRSVPAPRRGELVRRLGELLRQHKHDLATLVSIEAGKITSEALGEVQEMIDICDFAVGLSRQLHGLTIVSERPNHRMMEQWLPLGTVGVITAFNFPVAVWSWNAALALVCGNSLVWKPSEKTPLTAMATAAIFDRACQSMQQEGTPVQGLLALVQGGATLGRSLAEDPAVALVSATGSCRMGADLAPRVAARFGRCLLELGGNNAVIIAPSANLDLAIRGTVFGAWGTAGQRCTTTRRLIVHRSLFDSVQQRMEAARRSLPVGNPMEAGILVGPLIDARAFDAMQAALAQVRAQGGRVSGGERQLADVYPQAWYAAPALAAMPAQTGIVNEETFAPILYMIPYDTLDEAIAMNNDVPQGLSSAIFTNELTEAERFMSACGSDCGIANVNLGTSGAEIGGAFGGEKQTGGGRESGSDAWKAYMRRATNTINYGKDLPLAQGVVFDT
jgi:aldehyde dehydrogenase (NAD+)